MPKSYGPAKAWALCLCIFELADLLELKELYRTNRRNKVLRKNTNVFDGVETARCCGVLLVCFYLLVALNILHSQGSKKIYKTVSIKNFAVGVGIYALYTFEMVPSFVVVFSIPCFIIALFLAIGGEDTPSLLSLLLVMALCSCFGLALAFAPKITIDIINDILRDYELDLLKSMEQINALFILIQSCHGLALFAAVVREDTDFIWSSAESCFLGFTLCILFSVVTQNSLFIKHFCLYLWYFFQMYLLWPIEKKHDD